MSDKELIGSRVMPPYSAIMNASQIPGSKKRSPGGRAFWAPARPLGRIAADILSPAFRKRGFAQSALLDQWSQIAGEELARHTLPEKISHPRGSKAGDVKSGRSRFSRGGEDGGGVLTLRVDGPFAVEIQHTTPQLLERINGFFGYRAISRIALKQGPLPQKYERRLRKIRPLSTEEEQDLDIELQPINDDRLRRALRRLGRGVKGERK